MRSSSRRLFWGSIASLAFIGLVVACNTVDPSECWPNTSGGLGGSETIPIGAAVGASSGDFSAPPSGPLDYGGAPNPCIEKQTPCNEQCYTDYEAAAAACGKIEGAAQRKSCQDDAYATYKQCRAGCGGDPVEECKKRCDKENLDCIARCPKGDKECMNKCNQKNGKCLKDCEK